VYRSCEPIETSPTDCASLRTTGAVKFIKIRSLLVAYNFQPSNQNLPMGYRFSVRHGYKRYPWHTEFLYPTGKFDGSRHLLPVAYRHVVHLGYGLSRGVPLFCTPRVLWLGQPTLSQYMLVAFTYSVRHGYGHSRGVHFSCTPPLCSRGVQKFMYATKDNSSYSYFPSSGRI
jgi:hypothetical protein